MSKKSVAGSVLDPTIHFATLVIDEKEYKLCYSFNALALAEAAAGTNLLRGIENLYDLTAIQLRGLFFAALTVAQPTISIEEAGTLIRLDTLALITGAIAQAYANSYPKKKEVAEEEAVAS